MAEPDTDWIPGLIRPLRVPPGSAVNLATDHDPGARLCPEQDSLDCLH